MSELHGKRSLPQGDPLEAGQAWRMSNKVACWKWCGSMGEASALDHSSGDEAIVGGRQQQENSV